MKKLVQSPFIGGIMVVLIVISSILSYQLFFINPHKLSSEELIQYANENSISYYQNTQENNENTGVVLSYYMAMEQHRVHAKVMSDERVQEISYAFQGFTSLGKSFYLDNSMLLGFSNNQLKEDAVSYTMEKDGATSGGSVELERELGVNPFRELVDLYDLKQYENISDNKVIINEIAANIIGVKVGDTITLKDTPFVVQDVIAHNDDTSNYYSLDFFDKYVDVPFVMYNQETQNRYFTDEVNEDELSQSKSTLEQNKEEKDARLAFDNIIEYRITFANREDAEKYLAVFKEYMDGDISGDAPKREPMTQAEIEQRRKEADDHIKGILEKEVEQYELKNEEFKSFIGELGYYQHTGETSVVGYEVDEENRNCLDVETITLTLYNSSASMVSLEAKQFILNINNQDYIPQNIEELNMELQAGEKKTTRLIYRYDYPGKTLGAYATQVEKNEYYFDVIYYFIDEQGNRTEYMAPIKGGNMRGCVASSSRGK